MIHLTDTIWIGNSAAIKCAGALGTGDSKVTTALNVACDLLPGEGLDPFKDVFPAIEYTQVGLMDGPGNEMARYCAAVLTMVSLLSAHKAILVYDHSGGRALAVSMMYLCLTNGRRPAGGAFADFNNPHCWRPWAELHATLSMTVKDLPEVHPEHIKAYDQVPYGILEAITRS